MGPKDHNCFGSQRSKPFLLHLHGGVQDARRTPLLAGRLRWLLLAGSRGGRLTKPTGWVRVAPSLPGAAAPAREERASSLALFPPGAGTGAGRDPSISSSPDLRCYSVDIRTELVRALDWIWINQGVDWAGLDLD